MRANGKIIITKVDPEVYTHKGLFDGGCYSSQRCNDDCCIWGCDVDLAALKLIYKHKDLIEPMVGRSLENCFSTPLKKDTDYVGGAYRETKVRETDGKCAFHLVGEKGCALFYLWAVKGLPKRIVPTICRIYPLSWHRGRLFIDRPVRRNCKCLEAKPKGVKKIPSIFETQEREIRECFEIRNGKSK